MSPSQAASIPAARRRELWTIVLVFCVALAFRADWFLKGLPAIGGDEVDYDVLARNIHDGAGFVTAPGQYTAFRTPGLPLAVSPFYGLYPDHLPYIMRSLALISCLTAPLLYLFTRGLLHDRTRAMAAAILWGASTSSIRQAGKFMGEEFGAFGLLAGFAVMLLAEKRRSTPWGLLAGLLLGFASLTRGYLLLVTLVPVAWLVIRRARPMMVAASLVATLVIPVAWMARNQIQLGSPTFSTEATIQLWLGNGRYARGGWPGEQYMNAHSPMWEDLRVRYPGFDQFSEVQRSKVYFREFLSDLRASPGHLLWLLPRKLALYIGPVSRSYAGTDWLYLFASPFFLLGAIALFTRRDWSPLWLLAMPVAIVGLVCAMTFGDPRFRHPVDPFILVLASCGLGAGSDWWRARRLA